MAVAWFLTQYTITINPPGSFPVASRDLPLLQSLGVAWQGVDLLNNYVIVKVRGTVGNLSQIVADDNYTRLPKDALNDPLSDLTAGQKTALRNAILDIGYTSNQIRNALGDDLGAHSLGDVIRFLAVRRHKPRLHEGAVVFDEEITMNASIVDALDRAV